MAGAFGWLAQHGFDLISSFGIVAGLLFTSATYRSDTRSRRLSNLISLTQQHRAIWDNFIQKPALERVLNSNANLKTKPVTAEEDQFVGLLILHLYCWFRAVEADEVKDVEGLSRDIRAFFDLPIPRKIWYERREFYDADFAWFVERNIQGIKGQNGTK